MVWNSSCAFKMWVKLTLSIVLKVGKCKDSFELAAMWGRETNLAEHGINLAHVLGKPPFNYEHFVQHLDIFRASTIWRVWPWQQFSLCKDPLPFPFNWMDPFATSPLSLLFSGGVATMGYCLFYSSRRGARLVRLVIATLLFVCLNRFIGTKVFHVTYGKAQYPNFIECPGTHHARKF